VSLTKVRVQKGEVIERDTIAGANHFFVDKHEELIAKCEAYVDRRLVEDEQKIRLEADTSKKRGAAAIPNQPDDIEDDEDEGDDD